MSPMIVHTVLFTLLVVLPIALIALLVSYWRRSR
ncbi:Uncharacterised protein [Collinsella intestinalis]|uniref:Uncharacterized protein n=1 Tax=Collinsella intestinalis TaxID=147207 RepID=A0A5K1IQN4_9ACTN|nr:Uncharacterised protein [Collinsella intestinalis]